MFFSKNISIQTQQQNIFTSENNDYDMADEDDIPTITSTTSSSSTLPATVQNINTFLNPEFFSASISISHQQQQQQQQQQQSQLNSNIFPKTNDAMDDDEDISGSTATSSSCCSTDDAEIGSSSVSDDDDDDVDIDDDMGANSNPNSNDVTGQSNSSINDVNIPVAIPSQLGTNLQLYDVTTIRSMLAQRGLKMPTLFNTNNNNSKNKIKNTIPVRTFTIFGGYELLFSPYFFIVRVPGSGTVLEARIIKPKRPKPASSSSSLCGDGPINPLCASTPAGLTCGTASKAVSKTAKAERQYSVGQQSFTFGPGSVLSQSLRDQLKASEATMSRLMAQIQEERQPSPTARKVLHLLKDFFVEIKSYRYEVGRNSNKWNGVRGIAGADLARIAAEAQSIMAAEPTLLRLDPPVYVIGDLHGNYKDFSYFAKSFGLWSSAEFTPAKFLFLGDYVDRGLHSIETLAFVLALKVLFPEKIYLLRGNHECADVNGDEDTYQDGSFRRQCSMTYGRREGARLWQAFNACFDQMPLAAVIDSKIFCVHAGIPRDLARRPDVPILESIAGIARPPDLTQDLVFDLVWADPATPEEEAYTQGVCGFPQGFGPNARGPATCVFGKRAVEMFCRNSGCSHLIRAHQSPKLGVDIAKNATILTVFSSSHYCGAFNRAAAVLVHDHKIDVIVSSPSADADTPNVFTRDYVQ